MRLYALIKNNKVVEIKNLEDDEYTVEIKKNDSIVDIEDMSPQPQIGWILSGNTLIAPNAVSMEILLREKIKQAREFGQNLIYESSDRIGAKNILFGKTEAQIVAIVAQLDPIKKLLETGALNTARTQLNALKLSLPPELHPEIDRAVNKITEFLGS